MRVHLVLGIVAWLIVACLLSAYAAPEVPTQHSSSTWSFDADVPGTLPRAFHIGTLFDGKTAGEWKVLKTDRAKSPPHVLGQVMPKGAEHACKTVLINGTEASDVDLEVSFLAIAGKADMGGGLIWRATDDRNYYLTRANPLEQNIRVYRVVKGVRHLLQNFDHTIDVKHWHRLRVTTRGCQIRIYYDETPVLDLCD